MTLPARWWKLEEDTSSENAGRDRPARDKSGHQPAAEREEAARCGLCIHNCLIPTNKWGYCEARRFDGEKLVSPYLGRFSSIAVDPIEKKPLYHWRPGSAIFSLGGIGCTMRCPFCQNCGISHPPPGTAPRRLEEIPPEVLTARVRKMGLSAVAYTYNEPALQAEYILDAAPLLREAGIATVLVSNGLYSPALLKELAPVIDAVNIDLKTFNPKNYLRLGGDLETVKNTIRSLLLQEVHVEVTTLVVPGISDSPDEFAAETDWLASLSPDIPLHISRYRPAYKYSAPPTDIVLLQRLAAIAGTRLRHVHIGNVPTLRLK